MLFWKRLRKTSVNLRTKVGYTLNLVVTGTGGFTLTRGRMNRHRNRGPANQLGNHWDISARRKDAVSPTSFHHIRPRVSHRINDNYCVKCSSTKIANPEQRDCKVSKFVLAAPDQTRQPEKQRKCKLVSVKFFICNSLQVTSDLLNSENLKVDNTQL